MIAGWDGLAAEEAFAELWVEERRCVDAGHLVKTVDRYPSAGNS